MTDAVKLMRILALSDSAFPVGAFAFSAGLESAVEHRIVTDAASLEAYARQILRQAAFTDGIAALQAHRSAAEEDYDGICEADAQLLLCKMNAESRLMTLRMGRKLAELSLAHDGRLTDTWHEHLAILEAMENGDVAHIYEITLTHMETAREINLEDL